MDENISAAERQNRPQLDASKGVTDELARAAASSTRAAQDQVGQTAPAPASDAIPPRSLHLAIIAAALAAAAALGSFAGSLAASGISEFWPRIAAGPSSVAASQAQASNVELAAALKTYVEGASRNANHQFATLADRLDRIERAQGEPNAKLARVAEAVDRLEKATKSAMVAAAAPAVAAPETTGIVPKGSPSTAAEAKTAEAKILPNWILHGVRGRHALVENRRGDIFEISDESTLPGLGRVEGISGRVVNGSL